MEVIYYNMLLKGKFLLNMKNHPLYKRTFLFEEGAARIMYKLFSAVSHMHDNNIMHRDLKMENILFSSKDNNYKDSEVKIIDFGLSTGIYFGD